MTRLLTIILLILLAGLGIFPVKASNSTDVYIPLIKSGDVIQPGQPFINIPYFDVANIIHDKGWEMGVFWFGRVTLSENYADVKLGYNNSNLEIQINIFDRLLWYDPAVNSSITQWDAIGVTIQTGLSQVSLPTTNAFQIVSGLHWGGTSSQFVRTYRGNGSGWSQETVNVSATAGWRGNAPNDNTDDRGWTMSLVIPFSSLGGATKPTEGTIWRLGITLYDRDSDIQAPLAPKYWPKNSSISSPSTWGYMRFGLPVFTSPQVTNQQTTTIRHGLNNAIVSDAAVGGGSVCGDGLDFFSQWGFANYAGDTFFNIQNQADVADFPCFSKTYLKFPLAQIPGGKRIKSAQLKLIQFGNSDPGNAYDSLIQVLTTTGDWQESSINWNNAPLALENISRTWVGVIKTYFYPGVEYSWDVSRAAINAYQQGIPLNLVIYSADTAMHSGKYFCSSDATSGNEFTRPTLIVEWGDQ